MNPTPVVRMPGKWNLDCLYKNGKDPQIRQDIIVITEAITVFVAKYAGLSAESSVQMLAAALHDFEELQRSFLAEPTIDDQLGKSKPEYYWMLRLAMSNTKTTRDKMQRLGNWHQQQLQKLEFFFQAFDNASQERRTELLAAPELRAYWPWLKQRFMLPIAAAPTAEARAAAAKAIAEANRLKYQLNAAIGNATATVWNGTAEVVMSLPGIMSLVNSPDPRVAREAGMTLPKLYAELEELAFKELMAALAAQTAEAGLHGGTVKTVRCASDTLAPDVLTSLLETLLGPDALETVQAYYELKAALNKKYLVNGKLPYAQRRTPYGVLQPYTWPEAVGLIRMFGERTDPAIGAEFNRALAEGCVDAEPRKGKTGVTACWWALGLQPMFAVTFTGDLENIAQVVHEFFAHYRAAQMVSEQRDGLSYNTRIPLAESQGVGWQLLVPLVLADKLDLDANGKLVLAMAQLETLISTVFLQGIATAFEQQMYAAFNQGTLDLPRLKSLFVEYMHKQFGDAVAMDELASLNWLPWSQLRQGFYNYAYAIAGMIAIVVRKRYEADPAAAIRLLLTLMGAGSKSTLTDIFAEVGIELGPELWRECIQIITEQVKEAIDLARQLGLYPAA